MALLGASSFAFVEEGVKRWCGVIAACDIPFPLRIEDAKKIPEHMKQKKEGKNSGRQNRLDWEHAIGVSCVLGSELFFLLYVCLNYFIIKVK